MVNYKRVATCILPRIVAISSAMNFVGTESMGRRKNKETQGYNKNMQEKPVSQSTLSTCARKQAILSNHVRSVSKISLLKV